MMLNLIKNVAVATVATLAVPAHAQQTDNFAGLSFSLEGGTGGHVMATAAYMFPAGNGSLLVGPVVGVSGYSLTHINARKGKPIDPTISKLVMDKIPGTKTTTYDAQFSLGVRLASVFENGRGLIYGEIGAERYGVDVSQEFFSKGKRGVENTSSHDVGAYAALGAEFCASKSCTFAYTGQIRYRDQTQDISAYVGVGLKF